MSRTFAITLLLVYSVMFVGCNKFEERNIGLEVAPFAEALSIDRAEPASAVKYTQESITVQGRCIDGFVVSFSSGALASSLDVSCSAGRFSAALTLSGADGLITIRVSQTNRNGREWADSLSVMKDTVAPNIEIVSMEQPTNSRNLLISGTCEMGAVLELAGDITSFTGAECIDGAYRISSVLSPGDAEKNLEVRQIDQAGNIGRKGKKFRLDTLPPAVTIASPAAGSQYKSTFSIVGTCEQGLNINVAGTGINAPQTQVCSNGTYNFAVELSAGDGPKLVTVTQIDLANNRTDVNTNYVKDTVAPTLSILTPAANAAVGGSVTISGVCESGLTVSLSGSALNQVIDVPCLTGAFSKAILMSAGEGSKTILATESDLASNKSSVSISIIQDTIGPTLNVVSPINNSHVQNSAAVSGICDTGLLVYASGSGLSKAMELPCAGGLFQGSLTFSDGDGSKVVSFSQVDAAQNKTEATRTFIKDTIAPMVQVMTPVESATVATSNVTVTGRCESGLTVKIQGSGLSAPVQASCLSSSFSAVVVLTAGDGVKPFEVSQIDLAGNSAKVSRTINKSLSSITPIAITAPAANIQTQGSLSLQGTCESGISVAISGDVSAPSNASCVGGAFSQTITLSAGDDLKTVNTAQTVEGVTSMSSRAFYKDATAPVIKILQPAANTLAQNEISLTGTCESGLNISVSGEGVSSVTTLGCASSVFSVNVVLSTGDGPKLVRVSQTDLAGNMGMDSRTFLRDTIGPTLTILSPTANFANPSGVTLQGSCEGANPVQISGTGTAAPGSAACVTGSYQAEVNFSVGEGPKLISVSQSDLAGNSSIVSRNFLRDSISPSVTISAPAAGTTSAQGLTISGSCESGLQVKISGAGLASAGIVSCSNSAYSAAIVFSAGEGTKTVQVVQTDGAGNIGSAAQNFIRDSISPFVSIVTPSSGAYAKSIVTITGACESEIPVVLYGAGVTANVSATCSAGLYSATVTLTIGDGTKEIRAGQTDLAQNFGTASVSIIKDTTAPSLAILSPAAGTIAATGLSTSGSCESGLPVDASGSGLASAVQTNCISQTYNLNIVFSAGDGNKTVVVSQTDKAGNSFSVSRDFVKGQVTLDGAQLYANNCAGCHGPLATSSKLGRTATQISAAIAPLSPMESLSVLTSAEINAIAAALVPTNTLAKFQCTNPAGRGLSEDRLRRLTRGDLINTLSDLLGADIIADSAIQIQFGTLPEDAMKTSVAEIASSPPESQPGTMLNISSRLVEILISNSTLRNRVYGSCSGASPVTNTCAIAFISSFGTRAYRRPLTTEESASYLSQFQATGGAEGLHRVLMRFLMDPSMVFHVELGTTVNADRVRLTDYEIASRISYRITGSMPDSLLMQAAGKGELQDLTNVRAQAKRLLTTLPQGKTKVGKFFRFYTRSELIPVSNNFAGKLNGIDTTGLQVEMVNEIDEFTNQVTWTKNGKFKDLLTSTEVFPRSDRMAKILETTIATGSAPSITNVAHAGLLLRPGVFASTSTHTLPFSRAALVRKGFLCEEFGSPDPNAVNSREAELGDLSNLSTRDRLTRLTDSPQCLTCHGLLNPVGFSLEGYDQLGMRRSIESVFNETGAVVGTFPINTNVGRTYLYDGSGNEISALENAIGLANAVADGVAARACFAQRVFEFQRARSYVPNDTCLLSEVENAARDTGTILDAFISAVSNEDIFWKAKGN